MYIYTLTGTFDYMHRQDHVTTSNVIVIIYACTHTFIFVLM